jgi:hypothetical protein
MEQLTKWHPISLKTFFLEQRAAALVKPVLLQLLSEEFTLLQQG